MNAIEKIRVIVVNGSKESKEDAPDYKTNPSQRIIAVGGLALSRGLEECHANLTGVYNI